MAQKIKIDNVELAFPEDMDQNEALEYYLDYKKEQLKSKLVSLDIKLIQSPDNPKQMQVLLQPHYDTIVRIRRITGYLSTLPRFNDAKKDEESQRYKHSEHEQTKSQKRGR